MIIQALRELFERDLKTLSNEISQYSSEEKLWETNGDIKNSAGNLVLHLCGNLQHFIGAILGNSSYIRKRDEEFSRKNVPAIELKSEIEKTKKVVIETLGALNPDTLDKPYPIKVFKNQQEMNTTFFLVHLSGHLTYHLGQINYHRRLLDN